MLNSAAPSGQRRPASLACIAVFVCIGLYVGMRPIDDVDVFWQILIGRSILERGFDATEFISYHNTDVPMAWVGWLGQIAFAAAHRVGGWEMVQSIHVLCFAAAFAVAMRRSRARGVSTTSAALAAVLMFVACSTNCAVRPQSFAFLAFSTLLGMLDGAINAKRFWIATPLLLVAWQNVHPSVPVAVGVCAAIVAGDWLDRRGSGAAFWRDNISQPSWSPMRCAACCIIAATAAFATPATWRIVEISARNSRLSRWLGIGEWQPPHTILDATMGFWLALGIVMLLLIRRPKSIRYRDGLPLLLLTVAALLWSRMIVFWALAAVPTTAMLINANLSRVSGHDATAHSARSRSKCSAATWCAALAMLFVASTPWLRQRLPIAPASCRSLFDLRLPIAGVDRLADAFGDTTGAKRIYCYREWAGLLAFHGTPDWRVSIDGRIYRYDQSQWRRYAAVAAGALPHGPIFADQHPDAIFLRPGHDDPLIENLLADRAWRFDYHDPNCHIFLPADILPADAVATE